MTHIRSNITLENVSARIRVVYVTWRAEARPICRIVPITWRERSDTATGRIDMNTPLLGQRWNWVIGALLKGRYHQRLQIRALLCSWDFSIHIYCVQVMYREIIHGPHSRAFAVDRTVQASFQEFCTKHEIHQTRNMGSYRNIRYYYVGTSYKQVVCFELLFYRCKSIQKLLNRPFEKKNRIKVRIVFIQIRNE